MNELGRWLREKREAENLTLIKLGARTGLSYVSIYNTERGKIVGSKILRALAKYYKTTTVELRGMMTTDLPEVTTDVDNKLE